jgi:hypothetical protein
MSESPENRRWQAGDWFFRLAVPCYIAAGALMKLFTSHPLQLPLISLNPNPSPEVERFAGQALPVIAAVELALAGVILLGGRWARWLAVAVMVAFAAVLVPHVRAAATSCGCFGSVHTNPTLMLITACGSALLIVLLPCTGTPPSARSPRVIVPWAVAVALLVGAVHFGQAPEKLGWRVPMMRLVADGWIGKRLNELPFYPMLDPDAGERSLPPFVEGEQTWVLWLRTCPHCHEYFRERWKEPTTRRIVAVEIPRSAGGVSAEPHALECPSCVRLHLRKGVFYFPPATPIVLTVKNGVVESTEINPVPAESVLDPLEQP